MIKKHGRFSYTLRIWRIIINTFPWLLFGVELRRTGLYIDFGFLAITVLKSSVLEDRL